MATTILDKGTTDEKERREKREGERGKRERPGSVAVV
jgi:hypothetical protein